MDDLDFDELLLAAMGEAISHAGTTKIDKLIRAEEFFYHQWEQVLSAAMNEYNANPYRLGQIINKWAASNSTAQAQAIEFYKTKILNAGDRELRRHAIESLQAASSSMPGQAENVVPFLQEFLQSDICSQEKLIATAEKALGFWVTKSVALLPAYGAFIASKTNTSNRWGRYEDAVKAWVELAPKELMEQEDGPAMQIALAFLLSKEKADVKTIAEHVNQVLAKRANDAGTPDEAYEYSYTQMTDLIGRAISTTTIAFKDCSLFMLVTPEVHKTEYRGGERADKHLLGDRVNISFGFELREDWSFRPA